MPDNATNKAVSWESSDTSVATVDNNGKVSAIKKGTATITVKTADGSFADTCVVSVACAHSNTTDIPAESSTCIKQGNDTYTVCDDCGIVVSGSDAKLPLGNHNFIEVASAEYLKTAATCKSKAVYYKSCSVCGKTDTETFEYGEKDATNHTGGTELRNKTSESCKDSGYSGDTWCLGCNTKIAEGTVINATGAHVDADGKWEVEGNQHYYTCGCGVKFGYENHKGGQASCSKQAVCAACNTAYGAKDANNHDKYEETVTAPTCVDKGFTTHICIGCQDSYVDTYTNPVGHIVEEWKVVEEASATKEGLKEGTCKVCSAELTVNIGKDITKVEQKDTTGTVVAKVEAVGDTVLNENVTLDAGNVTETLDAQTKAELDKKKDDFFGTSKKVTLISTWDISLVLRESATDGSEIKPLKYEPNGKIKVTIEVPANLLAKHKDVQLLHFLDNGTVESVNFVLDGTKVTFETDSLGYFAFAGTQIETETENTTSPKTADTSNVVMWIMLACVASVVCAGAVGVQKKRKYN